ncbi:flavodoxin family protein [Clostridiaceae bacterium M8S5]|nr:flavodoxin family protein [Clostridiaceae bacterium M8S5]
MNKKNIVAIIGTNNKDSTTKLITNRLLENIAINNNDYYYSIYCLSDYDIKYCEGCSTCFKQGLCPLTEKDDFKLIKNEISKANIVFFSSPVYIHNVTGIMKTFMDRTALSCHVLDFAGKLGFTLTTTYRSGHEKVGKLLREYQGFVGIKSLDNFTFIQNKDSIEEFVKISTQKFLEKIEQNYGYSNNLLEQMFNTLKDTYTKMSIKDIENYDINIYEWKYWNQKWIKECNSFQEFAVKNKKRLKAVSRKENIHG